jgi:hypothetical protein
MFPSVLPVLFDATFAGEFKSAKETMIPKLEHIKQSTPR